jgi:hypothetical protein
MHGKQKNEGEQQNRGPCRQSRDGAICEIRPGKHPGGVGKASY